MKTPDYEEQFINAVALEFSRKEALLKHAEAVVRQQNRILHDWRRILNEVSYHKTPVGRRARAALRAAQRPALEGRQP